MKQGWEIKKLGEVCDLKPQKKEAREKLSEDAVVTFLPMEDLGVLNKDINPTKQRVLREVVNGYTYFADNEVLLAKITPCFENGKLGIARGLINGIGFGSSEYIVFRSKGEIIPEYLFYFLSRCDFRDEGSKLMTGAVGHKRVTKEWVENYNIPIPPIPEQERIVSILDKAFSAIDQAKQNAEKNLKNVKELIDSYLQGVFESGNWETRTLKELTTKIGSGATPRGGQETYKSEGTSFVRSMNVHDWEFKERNLAFIDEKQAKELDGVTLHEDDVLLNITGASVTRCCVFPRKYLPARVNQHVSIIRPKNELLDSKFLNLLLTSKPYKDKLLFTGEQGATRQAITKAQIESFRVSIPLLKEQKTIVRQFELLRAKAQKLEANYQQKIIELEEIKRLILQKSFNGKLL